MPSSETATIDVDSTGTMWLASESGTNIVVYHSPSPYTSFTGPVTLATNVNADDIGVVTALPNDTVGVLWSNQTTKRFGFKVHVDGAAPDAWSADEVPASQSADDTLGAAFGMADDHLNVAVASDGTLYAAVKTSYDQAGYTKIALLVRRPQVGGPGGTWDDLYEVDGEGTRPIVLLNEATSSLKLVYTASESFNPIVYRDSALDPISFGPRQTLTSNALNDVTSTKQNWTDRVVVLASGSTNQIQAFQFDSGIAPNAAPVAVNDSYTTPESTPLTVAAPGVLANDTDADADVLSAALVSNVTHGTLSLAANGGFTYTPTAGYSGPDSFTYRANDGTVDSNTATVSLTVGPASLRGEWLMNGNASDSSTYGSNATLVGSPPFVAGRVGQALSLNGSTQYATVADAPHLDLTTGLTMAAWINPAAAATQNLIKKAVTAGATVNGYELSLASPTSPAGQRVFVRLNQATSGDMFRINSTSTYPTNGTWMHVAATYDGTTTKLYVNGVLENSAAGPAAIATNNLALALGAQSDAASKYTGLLDDVRLYSRALSAAEITALANANAAPVAVNDSYTTPEGTPLTVAAPGVLANDTDADANPLSAAKVTDPAHGSVSLAANGGFTYTPTAGYSGPDSFTYRANDGSANSNLATVSLSVAASLRGEWLLDGNASDSSSYGSSATLVGAPPFVAGRVGQALSLNGTSQYATVPDANHLDLTSGLTMAAWIRPAGAAAATQDVIKKATLGGINGYELSLSSAGKVFVRLNQQASAETFRINSTSSYPLNNTAWMHVAATYDGSTIRLYINGTLEGSVAGPAAIATNSLPLTLGAQSDATRFYDGLVDDVRLYSRALSAAEITTLATPPGGNEAP
ncbi:MAG TPA: LamG-like jellyroll fold domain-containing protein, partial [Gemmatimonadaceae bacterium]|nr:LamG-like jellyroll fold domain-containing protein [Gemmatimonadaceae bacterium]